MHIMMDVWYGGKMYMKLYVYERYMNTLWWYMNTSESVLMYNSKYDGIWKYMIVYEWKW